MDSGDLRSDYYWFPHLNDAYKVGDDYAAKLGCPKGQDRVTCLRNLKEVEITIPFTNWVSDWLPELREPIRHPVCSWNGDFHFLEIPEACDTILSLRAAQFGSI